MVNISKSYEPQEVEKRWNEQWTEAGCFTADPHSSKPPFSIVIPPPNVTGILHLGHVLNNTMQDVLCRRARMQGKEVLWLPGTDHAGIATQTKVEQKLRKEEGKTRHDVGREKFLEAVWDWKDTHGGIIINQLKRLGCSLDWSRERFTMDDGYSDAVLQVFVQLYREGLIYRGKRMVNWCPVSLTALSDEEVIMKPQKSKLYYMQYELVDEPGKYLQIATTRPETLMGDTAVAVSPNDKRYRHLIGKNVWRPFPKAQIPIIADEHIDPEFGTGVLKVTPAHDKADFEIGQRHKLEVIDVFHPNATLNELAGEDFVGLDRFAARRKAAEKLEEMGLLIKVDEYENSVGYSERADVPIEPRLSEQWFLRYPEVETSLQAYRDGEIKFHPARWGKVFENWLNGIQDWCISRQLWWGHRIPVWYRKGVESPQGADIYCDTTPPTDAENWVQDPDVLDTWFSSWLWPFATMDQPTRDKFYPTSCLSTGFDIIFFWVARMIMAGYHFEGKKPFTDIIIHNLVRDNLGRKMSKTLGNSPDPLDLIDTYGADGLRFGLQRIAPTGQDIRFDEKSVEEGRNFGNKLWNACRFREMQGDMHADVTLEHLSELPLEPYAVHILERLNQTIAAVDQAYADFRFPLVAQALYDFAWSEFCDWFLESAKKDMNAEDPTRRESVLAVMDFALNRFLRLLHPFMPHLTSELWERLGYTAPNHFRDPQANFLLYAEWPEVFDLDHAAAAARYPVKQSVEITRKTYEAARLARQLRAEYNVATNKKVKFLLNPQVDWAEAEVGLLAILAQASEIEMSTAGDQTADTIETGTPHVLTPFGELYMPLAGVIDVEAEKSRLDKEIERTIKEVEKGTKMLNNPSFTQKAPPEVVEEHEARLSEHKGRLKKLQQMRKALE